jgi:hypothetical protein
LGDTAYLVAKGYITLVKDTIGIDEDQLDKEELMNMKKTTPLTPTPTRDTSRKAVPDMIEPKKPEQEDSTTTSTP